MKRFGTSATASLVSGLLLASYGLAAQAGPNFSQTNLVSDGFVPAAHTDSSLINPWGMSYGGTGPIWVSDNGTGVTSLYNANTGVKITGLNPPSGDIAVTQGAGSTGSAPTGQVHNGNSAHFGGDAFIFASEDGAISGWKFGQTATSIAVDNSVNGVAVYKGLAIDPTSSFLYAADFRTGNIEMYNSSFGLVKTFTDPTVAAGYAPFNVQVMGGKLYVTFALQDALKHDDVAGAGNGYVDVFNLDGTGMQRLVSAGGMVNSPWGLDLAPAHFGPYSGDLLVGNFGDGTISAFDPTTGAFLGKLDDARGDPIVIGDLWGLINGNGGAGGDINDVYFTAGVQDEAHGLFGSLSIPEPSTWAMLILGVGLVGFALRRRGALAPA